MDALPPNDPNRNNNSNHNHSGLNGGSGKDKIVPPNPRRDNRRNGNRPRLNENGEMDVFGGGNMGDDMMIVAMFLMGAAAYLLRERYCTC